MNVGASAAGTGIDGGFLFVAGTASGTTIDGSEMDLAGVAGNTHLVSGSEHALAGGTQRDIDFGGCSDATLYLDDVSGLAGTISHFADGGAIVLLNVATLSYFRYDGTFLRGGTGTGDFAWRFTDMPANPEFQVISYGDGNLTISLSVLSQYSAVSPIVTGSGDGLVAQDEATPATLTTPFAAAV